MGFVQFVTRLCGVIGGVFVVIGMLLSLYHSVMNLFTSTNKYKLFS